MRSRRALRFGVFELSGGFVRDSSSDVVLAPGASTRLADAGEWASSEQMPFAVLGTGARSRLVLPTFKELQWAPSKLAVRVEDGRAMFESDTFVWGVCLDLDGGAAPADNFFDVYPGIPYSIPWSGSEAPTVIRLGNLGPRRTLLDSRL